MQGVIFRTVYPNQFCHSITALNMSLALRKDNFVYVARFFNC